MNLWLNRLYVLNKQNKKAELYDEVKNMSIAEIDYFIRRYIKKTIVDIPDPDEIYDDYLPLFDDEDYNYFVNFVEFIYELMKKIHPVANCL